MSMITNTRVPRDLQLHDGDLVHAYWQCTDHARQYLLSNPTFKELYLNLMAGTKKHYGICLIDFCLMDNHFHLLLRIRTVKEFSRFFQSVHTSFAKRVNHETGRTGSVVELRVKTQVVEEHENAVLNLQAYLALNRWHCPERTRPEDYPFSGYRHYAGFEKDERLDTSEAWLGLGETDAERAAAYRDLVEAKRLEGKAQDEEVLAGPRYFFGSAQYCLSRTEQLLSQVRAHNRELYAARKLAASDAAASCPAHGGQTLCRHADASQKD